MKKVTFSGAIGCFGLGLIMTLREWDLRHPIFMAISGAICLLGLAAMVWTWPRAGAKRP